MPPRSAGAAAAGRSIPRGISSRVAAHAVNVLHVLQGYCATGPPSVRSPATDADRPRSHACRCGELRLAGIVQIAAVHRQHIGHSIEPAQHLTHGTGRHHEMGVDHVEGARAPQRQTAQGRHRQIGQHRGKIRDREFRRKNTGARITRTPPSVLIAGNPSAREVSTVTVWRRASSRAKAAMTTPPPPPNGGYS